MNAKRIFALVMSVLMVFASFAAVMSVSAEEDKFAPTNEVQEQLWAATAPARASALWSLSPRVRD